jgi:protein-S-isoprenylcysteine O-methyltransferase Ste14
VVQLRGDDGGQVSGSARGSTPAAHAPAGGTPAGAAPPPPPLVRYGNFLFKYRDALFPAVLLAIFVLSRPRWPAGDRRLDDLLDVAGFAIALAGQVLRAAVVGYAYIIRGGKNKQVYAEDLVTRGFFNHGRNPLYVGNILILLGLLLIWNSPLGYLAGGPFFLVGYVAIVAAEEAFLRRKFGAEYDAYCARVPRWGVRLRGLGKSLEGMSFNWSRVVVKEYGSAAYWMAGALALMLADSLRNGAWDDRPAYHAALAAGIGLVGVLWGVARWLKKSKRLTEHGPAR